MATPTPKAEIHTPQAQVASKHLAPFSSPAPRSAPNTTQFNYDSPAVFNMLNEGGVGMGLSMSGMSQLGMSASAMGRAHDEEERRRRLETIIEEVKRKPGRVGEEGIMRLCARLGVEVEKMMEGEGLTLIIGNEAMCDIFIRDGEIENVKLATGLDDEKQRPDLKFGATGSEILLKSLKPLSGQNKINITLDRFSENLDKLLRLDKLGAPENGGVSCYHAIAGVYTSLKKLFEHEKKIAASLFDAKSPHAEYKAGREVLCKKSGRPRLNGGLCLGLSLEYWMDRRHIIRNSSLNPQLAGSKADGDKMDVDSEPSSTMYPEDVDLDTNKMYSLTIECESAPSSMYTPIRISNDWISSAIEKPADGNGDAEGSRIDWLDPKPTYLESSNNNNANGPNHTGASGGREGEGANANAMDLDNSNNRLPNIRFVAKFNPPLIVPLSVYVQLHQSVGIDPNAQDFRTTTFVGLALRPEDTDPGMASYTAAAGDATAQIHSARRVLVRDRDGREQERRHAYSLFVPKMEYSRALESLPFSHPRQLVEMLPTLRQYAFATALLKGTFSAGDGVEVEKGDGGIKAGNNTSSSGGSGGGIDTNALFSSHSLYPPRPPPPQPPTTENLPPPPPPPPPLPLDITLSYTPPGPRLTYHIPHPLSNPTPDASSPSSIFPNPAAAATTNTNINNTKPHTSTNPPPPISTLLSSLLASSTSKYTSTSTFPTSALFATQHPNPHPNNTNNDTTTTKPNNSATAATAATHPPLLYLTLEIAPNATLILLDQNVVTTSSASIIQKDKIQQDNNNKDKKQNGGMQKEKEEEGGGDADAMMMMMMLEEEEDGDDDGDAAAADGIVKKKEDDGEEEEGGKEGGVMMGMRRDGNVVGGVGEGQGQGQQQQEHQEQDQQGLGGEEEEERKKAKKIERIVRALEVCGDLGLWGEWVRREVGGGKGL